MSDIEQIVSKLRRMANYSDYPECCEWDQVCMDDAADLIEKITAALAASEARCQSLTEECQRQVEQCRVSQENSARHLNTIGNLRTDLATSEARCARLAEHDEMVEKCFNATWEYLDSVFQVDSTKPPPLLPNYCQLGERKDAAVIRLAKDYIAMREHISRLEELVRRMRKHPGQPCGCMACRIADKDTDALLAAAREGTR